MPEPVRSSRSVAVIAIVLSVVVICFLAVFVYSRASASPGKAGWNPLANWFLARAEEARKGAAMAGVKEAKATLSVAFARVSIARAQSGGDPKVSVADVIGTALGSDAGSGAQVAFGSVVVQFDLEPDENRVRLAAISVDGTAVEGVTDVWSIPANTN